MGISIGSMLSTTGNYNFNNSYNSNSNSESNLGLGDYAAIRNGSYGKLMKAYYKNQGKDDQTNKSNPKQNLSMIKSSADSLKNAAKTLSDPNLYEKKEIKTKGEDGTIKTTKDYDWDSITKAVKSFVDGYNNVLSKTSESNNKNVLRNGVGLVNQTNRVAQNVLSKAGISIGIDNKMSVDEDKLKNANVSVLKSLFVGTGSFGDQVSAKAAAVSRATQNSSGLYTSNATYSNTVNSLIGGSVDIGL